jgi:hypothetical protein
VEDEVTRCRLSFTHCLTFSSLPREVEAEEAARDADDDLAARLEAGEVVSLGPKEAVAPPVPEPASAPGRPLGSLVPGANSELVERARAVVDKAVRQHKIFVVFGQYSSVKRALRRRGWLEKPCDCCPKLARAGPGARRAACEAPDPYNHTRSVREANKL